MSRIEPSDVPSESEAFLAELGARHPGFRPSRADLAVITELCGLLGRDPGATRLVAAQIGPDELRSARDAIADLRRTPANGLAAALEFAYRRLAPEAQKCYRHAAVFSADFDPEAAMIVCSDARIQHDSIIDHLDALEDRLLIERAESIAEQRRYRLPRRGAANARARLERSGELPVARGRLIEWIWSRSSVLTRTYLLPKAETRWFADRLGYLGLAVEWTWEDRRDDRHDLLAGVLALFRFHAGRSGEGEELIRRALGRSQNSPYRSDLLTWGIWISELNSDPAQVIDVAGEAAETARRTGRRLALIRALTTLGNAHSMIGDRVSARRHFEEAIELAWLLGDAFTVSLCSHVYAWHLIGDDDPIQAATVMATTPSGFEELANPHQYASFQFVLGAIELALGDHESAANRFKQSVEFYEPGDASICFPLEGLALVALKTGQPVRTLTLTAATEALRGSATVRTRVPQWWSERVARAGRSAETDLSAHIAGQVVGTARRFSAQQVVGYALKGAALPLLRSVGDLTKREYEIALLVAEGLTNQQIAEHLHISRNTVSSHIRQIFVKLNIQSRTQLAAWTIGAQDSLDTVS